MRKVAFIGGGGVRTPLVIHGLAQAQAELNIGELVLFDESAERAETIARLGREIVQRLGGHLEQCVVADENSAAEGH